MVRKLHFTLTIKPFDKLNSPNSLNLFEFRKLSAINKVIFFQKQNQMKNLTLNIGQIQNLIFRFNILVRCKVEKWVIEVSSLNWRRSKANERDCRINSKRL